MDLGELDYYAILNLSRGSTPEQIALAYRKAAISYHPHRDDSTQNPPEGMWDCHMFPALDRCTLWQLVNKAYDTLSDPLKREVYDRYGETGLQRGVPIPNGFFPAYTYHGNYLKTYHDAFGSYSPYSYIIDAAINPPPLYSTEEGMGAKKKDKPIEKLLYLDLKDVYFGGVKRMKILRHEFVDAKETCTQIREKILVVPIAAGILEGSKITFREEGDRGPAKIPADIVFVIADKEHPVFYRKKSDLYMDHELDLGEALNGIKMTVETIDGRKLIVSVSDVIHTTYVKEVENEGFPKPNEPNAKGNLYIRFFVRFPTMIPREFKTKIQQVFADLKKAIAEEENEGPRKRFLKPKARTAKATKAKAKAK